MTQTATRGSLFAVFLTVFIDLLGFGMVLPLLPIYAEQFTPNETDFVKFAVIGLLASSFSAMQFLFSPVWGRVSDRIGRRPVLLIGLTGSAVCYALFGLATSMRSLTWMFVSRIGAGVAGATISTAQAYIADSTTVENRAKGMALIGAAFGLGFTFGPLLAAVALLSADNVGLSPWPGYTAAILSSAALLFAFFKLPESKAPNAEAAERKLFDIAGFKAALKVPTIGPLLLISFVAILSFANFEGILAFLLKTKVDEGGFGFDIIKVVLFFAMLGFVHAMAQGLVRSMSSRTNEANLATLGTLTAIIGFVLLAVAASRNNLTLLIVGMFVEGIGFAFLPPAIQSLISRRSDPEQQGRILGVGQSFSALARIFGHGICFPLFYVSATLPFWMGAALMAVALLLVTVCVRGGKDFAAD